MFYTNINFFLPPRPNFKAYILFGTVRVRFPDYWNMLTYILSLYSSESCYLISAIIYMNIIYALYPSSTPPRSIPSTIFFQIIEQECIKYII